MRGGRLRATASVVAVVLGVTGGVRLQAQTFTQVLTPADAAPLVDAAERQDRSAVERLLQGGADVDARQPDGATALHWAAHWNDLVMAERLLAAGADPDAVNALGVVPLALAALNASHAVVDRLLAAGASPDHARESGETVLMTASRTGNPRLVRALLRAGAEANPEGHFRGQTPLMWAASEGHADVARVLVAHGADLEARSRFGITPLLLAARNGDVETARVLVEAGADVDAAEPYLAFDARVDVEESQTSGRSPLLVAAASQVATSGWEYSLVVEPSTHEDVAIYLLEHGADPHPPDSIGRTALHAAVETGKAALVRTLLAHGADPNARFTQAPYVFKGDFVAYGRYVGATPLWLAASAQVPDVQILRALAGAGGDPDAAADDGTTPLMAAVGMVRNEARLSPEHEALEIVEFLVQQDIDVNAVDRRGRTAMHGAARLARNSLIQVLVDHGGDVNVPDARGLKPLDVGTVSRPLHPDTEALLRRFGATSHNEDPAQR